MNHLGNTYQKLSARSSSVLELMVSPLVSPEYLPYIEIIPVGFFETAEVDFERVFL